MKTFNEEITQRNLMVLWTQGLGLEQGDHRAQRIYNYKEAEYGALRALGWSHVRSIEETLGLTPRHKGAPQDTIQGLRQPLPNMDNQEGTPQTEPDKI